MLVHLPLHLVFDTAWLGLGSVAKPEQIDPRSAWDRGVNLKIHGCFAVLSS